LISCKKATKSKEIYDLESTFNASDENCYTIYFRQKMYYTE
jgi:hypothetical protein